MQGTEKQALEIQLDKEWESVLPAYVLNDLGEEVNIMDCCSLFRKLFIGTEKGRVLVYRVNDGTLEKSHII
jgi:hypothetical protein